MDLPMHTEHNEEQRRFWMEFLKPDAASDTVILRRSAHRAGISAGEKELVLLRTALFETLQFGQVEWLDMSEPFVDALLELTAAASLQVEALVEEDAAGHYWLVLRQTGEADLQKLCADFADFCGKMETQTECCWISGCDIVSFRAAADQIRLVCDDAGPGKGWLIDAQDYSLRGYRSGEFFAEMKNILADGCDAFLEAVNKALDEAAERNALDFRLLKMMRPDLERLLRESLDEKQLDIPSVMETAGCMDLLARAHFSRTDLMRYLRTLLKPVRQHFAAADVYPEPVRMIIAYLDENPSAPYSRSILGEAIGLNPNYLAALFKESTGMSISTWRGLRQLETAVELLTETKLSIAEIAAKAGFGDPAYFCNAFRKKYGMSPGEYRKQQKS